MSTSAEYISCLELLPISWLGSAHRQEHDDAVLLGVRADGGEFHVEVAVPEGTVLRVGLPHGEVNGVVQKCTSDEHHGYILEVSVPRQRDWFGGRYRPTYLQESYGDPQYCFVT